MRLDNLGMSGATSRRNPANTTGFGATPMDIMKANIALVNENRAERAIITSEATVVREQVQLAKDKSLAFTIAIVGGAFYLLSQK